MTNTSTVKAQQQHPIRVHDFLSQPDAYSSTSRPIEVRETHISWVYLTDRFAFKQKKPVTFEFLDYSTLEARHHFCKQEVELNRRFSPDVYLGVVPVTHSATRDYAVNGEDEIVEWLVKMRRLDQATTLEQRIRRSTLTETHMKQLADHLAASYSSLAPVMVRSVEFRQGILEHLLANGSDLLRYAVALSDDVRYITHVQKRALRLLHEQFSQRVVDGRIVDGHGDLRPDHIYLEGPQPQIIDCIEFSAEYRTNDVLDELAFLSMECDRLGATEVGARILEAYAAVSGDIIPAHLVQFYKCYRACVRAKVAALRTNQVADHRNGDATDPVAAYLHLAKDYCEALGGNVVIILGGLMGTGKSTLGGALQDALGAELLSTDEIRASTQVPKDAASFRYGEGRYELHSRQAIYDQLMATIPTRARRSPTVILDGSFMSTANRRAAGLAAKAYGARLLQVQCECPAHVAKHRIAERLASQSSTSEARPELYDAQSQSYEPLLENAPQVRVETTKPISEQVDCVLGSLRELLLP